MTNQNVCVLCIFVRVKGILEIKCQARYGCRGKVKATRKWKMSADAAFDEKRQQHPMELYVAKF